MLRKYKGNLHKYLENKISPELGEDMDSFKYEDFFLGTLVNKNGLNDKSNFVIHMNDQRLLLFNLNNIESPAKETNFNIIEYSNIQGVQIKRKILKSRVIIQLKDGRNFQIEFKDTKEAFQDHDEKVNLLINRLESLGATDMKHRLNQKNIRHARMSSLIYVITLILILLPLITIGLLKADKINFILYIILTIALVIFHFFAFLIGTTLVPAFWDRAFIKEFNSIDEEYRETEDSNLSLRKLENIENQPKLEKSLNIYYLALAYHLKEIEKYDEALSYLNKTETTDDALLYEIKKEKYLIEKLMDKDNGLNDLDLVHQYQSGE